VLQHDGAARAPDTRAPDISSPDDASEREAARTADAVAAGNRVSVRPLAGPEAHALHRDAQGLSITANKKYNEADSLHEVAVEAEQGDKDLQMQSSAITNQQVLTTTVVDDARIADSEMKKIREAEKPLLEAIGHHALSGDLLADNHDALAKLGEYMAVSGFQAASLSNFQQEYVKLMQDFDRLDAMAAMMDVGDPSGAKTGDSIVKSQQLTEADQARMKADVNNPDKVASGGLTTKKGLLDAAQDKMFNASRNLGILELDISAQSHKVLAQVNNIAAGLPSREAPKEVKELNELKEKLEQIKKFASGITQIATVALGGYLGTAVGAIGEGGAAVEGGLEELGGEAAAAEAKSEGKKAAEEVVGERSKEAAEGLIEALVTAPWAKELAEAEAKAKAALGDQTFAGQKQQWEELVAQKNILEQAVSKYVNEAIVLQQAKAAVRRSAIEVGMVADKSGGGKGNKWQTLGTWYGELQAYIAQSTATRAIGKNEQEEADHTAHERAAINTTAASVHWWSVRTVKSVTSSYEELVADRHGVVPASGKGSAVSTEYRKGANDIIDDELKRLKMYEDHITQIRDVVAAAFVGRRDE
jgi:hypothetical protein